MAKFTVDRQTWYRGTGSSQSKLLTGDGKMCCIGFVCSQAGLDEESIFDRATIYSINPKVQKTLLPSWIRADGEYAGADETDILSAYDVNDNTDINDEEREQKLKEIFAKNGDEIEFIN